MQQSRRIAAKFCTLNLNRADWSPGWKSDQVGLQGEIDFIGIEIGIAVIHFKAVYAAVWINCLGWEDILSDNAAKKHYFCRLDCRNILHRIADFDWRRLTAGHARHRHVLAARHVFRGHAHRCEKRYLKMTDSDQRERCDQLFHDNPNLQICIRDHSADDWYFIWFEWLAQDLQWPCQLNQLKSVADFPA